MDDRFRFQTPRLRPTHSGWRPRGGTPYECNDKPNPTFRCEEWSITHRWITDVYHTGAFCGDCGISEYSNRRRRGHIVG